MRLRHLPIGRRDPGRNTPLIRLNRLGQGLPGRIAIKHEGFNPYNSVKDRIGAAMIEDAVQPGRLRPGMVIVEPTSGNTGIGLPTWRPRGVIAASSRCPRR